MKTKQSGLIAMTALALSLAVALAHGAWKHVTTTEGGGLDRGSPMGTAIPDIPARNKEVVEKLGTLVWQLRNPRIASRSEIDFRLLGFSSSSVAAYEATASASAENFSQRVISLAYVSGHNKFAVVDGRLYREGEILGQGEYADARVRTITPTKVLLAGKEVRQWIEVNNPQAAAPVPVAAAPVAAATAPVPVPAAESQPAASPVERSNAAEAAAAFKGYADILGTIRDLERGGR